MTNAPQNPTPVATQRFSPGRSLRMTAASAVAMIGAVRSIAATSSSGIEASAT